MRFRFSGGALGSAGRGLHRYAVDLRKQTRRLGKSVRNRTSRTDEQNKPPYLYELDGGKLFSLAGLWESWKDPAVAGAEPLETFTLITTDANELAAEIHDRMPVIVHSDDRQAWLAGAEIPLEPFPTTGMSARRVSTFVNNSRHEGPECVA